MLEYLKWSAKTLKEFIPERHGLKSSKLSVNWHKKDRRTDDVNF